MAKQISSLWVGLTGNISGLTRSFTAAIAPVTKLANSVRSASGMVAGLGSKIAALSGIGAALGSAIGGGVLVNQQLEAIDTAAKLSDRLGIATEALAGLQHAGDLAGVSNENLTKGIEKMLNSVGEAAAGTGEARGAFAALGLSAADLANMSPEAAFKAIADGLAGIENAAQRATLAQDIFGKAGQGLLPLLMSGSKGIAAAQAEAERLGLTFSRIDAAKVEESNDAITRMKAVFVGAARSVAIAIAPAITKTSDLFREASIKARATLGPIVSSAISSFKTIYSTVGPIIGRIVGAVVTGAVRAYAAFLAFEVRVAQVFASVYARVSPIVVSIYNFVARIFGQVVSIVSAAGVALWGAVSRTFQTIYNFVQPIISAVVDVVAANWHRMLSTTIELGSAVWGFIRSVFGFILDLAGVIWSGITAVWNWGTGLITGSTIGAGITVRGVFEGIVGAARWLADMVSTTLGTMEFAINNWRDVFALAGTNALLTVVRLANQIQYFFTEVIPAVLRWFGENWREIFTDIGNFTATVFQNWLTNAANFGKALWSAIQGEGFDFTWTPLTEGFEATLKELPQIAEREIGELEGTLAASSEALSKSLSKGLGEHLANRQSGAEKAATKIGDGISAALNPPGGATVEAPKVETPEPPKFDPVTLDVNVDEDNFTIAVTPELKQAKAILAGSAEAQALRFASPILSKPITQASAPGAAPPLQQPQTPAAAQTSGMRDATKEVLSKLLSEAVKHSGFLERIERNTANPPLQLVTIG